MSLKINELQFKNLSTQIIFFRIINQSKRIKDIKETFIRGTVKQ